MYNQITAIPFEGPKSKNPFSFRYYDKNRVINGKTMAEHLRFALSWWHTCNARPMTPPTWKPSRRPTKP